MLEDDVLDNDTLIEDDSVLYDGLEDNDSFETLNSESQDDTEDEINDIVSDGNYNNDSDYIQSLSYDDLSLSDNVFTGMRVAGTGLIITLLCVGVISILKS